MMGRRVSLFIFCQSLGWKLMEKLQFVEDLAENRAGVQPILGDSSATLPTLLSGRLPQEHGHFGWFRYSPETSPFRLCKYLSYLPAGLRRSRRLRGAVVRSAAKANNITGRLDIFNVPLRYLPLFDFAERRDLLRPGGLGTVRTLVDSFSERGIAYFCSDLKRTDPENASALGKALERGEIRAAFLHLTGVDLALKREGAGSAALRSRTAWADHRIRKLYETAAAEYDRVDLVVFSDSGVLPVTDTFDLQGLVQQTGYSYGQDYAALYEPTVARFWFLTDQCRAVVTQLLDTLRSGAALREEELAQHGCLFPDGRFGEVIFLARPGTAFVPNYINTAPPAAASGYLANSEQMAAGFACNLADIEPPQTLTEIHDLLVRCAAKSAGIDLTTGRGARTQ